MRYSNAAVQDGAARDVRGLVLDVDGTLLASEDADAQAWREEFAAAGVPITIERYAYWWDDWSWHRETRMITRLANLAPGIDQEQVSARRAARYTDLCADLPLCPGMEDWLGEARAHGLRIAVATNDTTGRVPEHLDRLGLTGRLDAIVTPAEGARLKPAPDLHLRAAAELGVPAAACIAVEDAPHGARAAQQAGYAGVIFLPNSVTTHLDLAPDRPGEEPPVAICPGPAAASLTAALADLGLVTRDGPPVS
ncbi:MAG: HAD family phosphatase [Nocardiopsaceae bacterium]|nr:HAD family phosphatase [Nocardiopsaceae bacterium]